ncbi:MAG: YraN family protein [Actinomycetia bacterium]|nr:YraN family protein [Actinomycetes bacterium]
MPATALLGRRGEDAATSYLRSVGMSVLTRNWRRRLGEIDIIAREGVTLVMVEVKTRTGTRHGSPAEAITPAKLARLQALTNQYLAENHDRERGVRLDLVGVRIVAGEPHINHVRGISC